MVKMLVFKDIDPIIVGYIESRCDFRNLSLTSKYCNKLVIENKFFQEWQFLNSKDTINFLNACKFGCLNISKYLFTENNAANECAFRWSCFKGHLEVCKFLIQIDKNIDIHAENEYAFRWSCSDGHLEVCKFLIQLDKNIDIRAENEAAFNWSKQNKHFEVYNFLIQLDKKN